MRMLRLLLFIIFITNGIRVIAQTCSIKSPDFVCKEELINFDVTASAGIVSVSWDMGDATTSTQQSFNHKYSTKGTKFVKVILNLSGGATCTATKKITVYDLPQFKIAQKSDNIYCLWQNKVCLIDSSYATDSAVGIKKRLILWDDGDQTTTNNPPKGDIICHSYTAAGTFKVTIELTTDKDCKAKSEVEIKLLKDIVPKINVFSPDNEFLRYCDSAVTRFEDRTTEDTTDMVGKIYDWGDGTKVYTRSKQLSHFYQKSGTYTVSLSYIQKNGCVTKKDTVIDVTVYDVVFDITKNASKQCFGNVFRFQQNDALIGAWYYWSVNDTVVAWDQDLKVIDLSPGLGKKLVSLYVENTGCLRLFQYDTIEVIGIDPRVVVLNENQCVNMDTVYLKIIDKRYGMGKLAYFIDFGDDKAPSCTTSLNNGANINSNCNYSSDSLAKHFYVNGKCRNWRLTITDLEHGCDTIIRNGSINVERQYPPDYKFFAKANRECLGNKEDYYFNYSSALCDLVKIKMNLDSACGKKLFSPKKVVSYPYTKTCNKDGWVTMGFAVEFGNPLIYTGYDEKKDFISDPKRVCYDTMWMHNWFRVLNDPVANFNALNVCLPGSLRPVLIDSFQKNITFSRWDWNDDSDPDTFFMPKNDTLLPQKTHAYKKPGSYVIVHYLENEGRCFSIDTFKISLGVSINVDFDSVICPGSMVQLKDSIYYGDSSFLYWASAKRKQAGKETFLWDLGDGRGFSTDTANPVVSFPTKGNYLIQLAVKDSTNCYDTFKRIVNVGGVHAGIKKINKKIICDDIIQFFDSSYSEYKPPLDSITKYYWDFGDNGNPSTLKNPYQFYKTFGEYTIFQRVENSRGCKDSAYIKIKIEGPVARFEIDGDSIGCAPFRAGFKNTSEKTRDFIWSFGDPSNTKLSTNRDTNVHFTYTVPGTYYIYLLGSDSVINPNAGNALYFCKSQFPDTTLPNYTLRKIIVLPSPKADFTVNPIQCKDKAIVVNDRSDTIYNLYRWSIPGVDSVSTTSKSATLFCNDTGNFTILYYPRYPAQGPFNRSCPDSAMRKIRVTEIVADFDIIKDSSACPVFYFTNKTKGYKSFQWDLGESNGAGNNSTLTEFSHEYATEKGVFYPCLYVENFDGCADTICDEVNVELIRELKIPNVFTPDHDGFNDVFEILAVGTDQYDLTIFNRWGQVVFRSTKDGNGDDGNNWNGRDLITGRLFPEGTYFYMFNYSFKCGGEKFKANGTVTLIGNRE